MILNYFKTTWRFFKKNKLSVLINIAGLSIGIACSLTIYLYVNHELSFDRYHENNDRIYRITLKEETSGETDYNSETPFPLAPALRAQFPEEIMITRIQFADRGNIRIGEKVYEEKFLLFAEAPIFEVFDFNWIMGSPENAMKELNSVILTESLASKYFPGVEPLGKTINLIDIGYLKVTGVVEDPPNNTHLPYSMLINLDNLTEEFVGMNYDRWTVILGGFITYALLPDHIDPIDFEKQLNEFVSNIMNEEEEPEIQQQLLLLPLKEIHHDKKYSTLIYTTSKRTILIVGLVGIFILLIACINYINLAIAQAIKRSKEVGIRKVLGADRPGLFRHYIADALLLTIIALVIAIILVEVFIPGLNTFLGNNVQLSIYNTPSVFIYIFILVLGISLISGLYPAAVISGYSPIAAINNRISSHKRSTKLLKNGLVVIQFIISQVLIISTLVITTQLGFMMNTDLGFEDNSIISAPVPDIDQMDLLRHDLEANPSIQNVTFAISGPQTIVDRRFETVVFSREIDDPEKINTDVKAADSKYLETFKLKLLAGEFYESARGRDSVRNVVINEALSQRLGYADPDSALGKRINMGRIVGVVKDFHIESLHNEIIPMVMLHYTPFLGQVFIKVNQNNMSESIEHIQSAWEGLFPDANFRYRIYDEFLTRMYSNDTKILSIIRFFSIIAIILACLGLFGLVSYMMLQKTKEASIRKVFGASIGDVIMRSTRSYFSLIILANIISFPVAWYFMDKWLSNFAYRITIHWWIFAIALIFSLLITFATIFFQIHKIARANPADALKYE